MSVGSWCLIITPTSFRDFGNNEEKSWREWGTMTSSVIRCHSVSLGPLLRLVPSNTRRELTAMRVTSKCLNGTWTNGVKWGLMSTGKTTAIRMAMPLRCRVMAACWPLGPNIIRDMLVTRLDTCESIVTISVSGNSSVARFTEKENGITLVVPSLCRKMGTRLPLEPSTTMARLVNRVVMLVSSGINAMSNNGSRSARTLMGKAKVTGPAFPSR
mmetsp:Transcript_14313/g.24315  ORF Transcript_14313/g.24315 Transcript_14313/m.24315 type:complete len:214 (+) Transcript_14313:118-759(+)